MDILISGAGVAGTALAFWLRRYGFTPRVVERAPAPRDGGFKIDIRGAAVEVVRRAGLLEDLDRLSTGVADAHVVDRRGRRVVTLDAEVFGGRDGEDVEIVRGDLLRVLRSAADPDIRYGDHITGLEQRDDGVRVTFAHAAARTFDMVCGADGLHSGVRALAFGDEARFRHDLGYHVAVCSVPGRLGLDRQELLYLEPGRTANVYRTAGDEDATALFLFRRPPGGGGPAALLVKAFAGAGWRVTELLSAAARSDDLYFDSVSQIHMDCWSSGPVVLVGDAAHAASPASGQGTSLALVGAYVLAAELATGDPMTASARYEEAMRGFVAANQALAHHNLERMVLGSRTQIWVRTRTLRALPHLPGREKIIERMSGPIREAATAVHLKDYPLHCCPFASATSYDRLDDPAR